ncbi:hypothetical protein H9W84_03220 [Moraxella sp. PS-22]|uniref:Uncharacterized protein n=1 Tax=Moraxella tetraodonis TaxID=2767221 RepID=A0A9X2A2T9_9GAMM|nr:hypothetical protein [Moraxella tetraodonis]MCG8147137.1 hypothetical protein [Moraxella tetraodonis]
MRQFNLADIQTLQDISRICYVASLDNQDVTKVTKLLNQYHQSFWEVHQQELFTYESTLESYLAAVANILGDNNSIYHVWTEEEAVKFIEQIKACRPIVNRLNAKLVAADIDFYSQSTKHLANLVFQQPNSHFAELDFYYPVSAHSQVDLIKFSNNLNSLMMYLDERNYGFEPVNGFVWQVVSDSQHEYMLKLLICYSLNDDEADDISERLIAMWQ